MSSDEAETPGVSSSALVCVDVALAAVGADQGQEALDHVVASSLVAPIGAPVHVVASCLVAPIEVLADEVASSLVAPIEALADQVASSLVAPMVAPSSLENIPISSDVVAAYVASVAEASGKVQIAAKSDPDDAPKSFPAYLKMLSKEESTRMCASYHVFKEAEEKWLSANKKIKKIVMKQGVKRRATDSRVRYRLATGTAFLEWEKTEGKGSKRKLAEFLEKTEKFDGKVPKKKRVWLAECAQMAASSHGPNGSLKNRKATKAVERTPDRFLKRQRKRQGAKYKCPLIREMLWDWFVDIRRSLATTISSKCVIMKARELADQVLKVMRESGDFGEIPFIDTNWLHRFKRDKGIVWRKPNLRFKTSRPTMKRRLRATWINDIKIRRAAELCLGKDLADQIFGLDEKPIHFNESGSKNMSTLEIAGAPVVKLLQNHAATRERASVMTWVVSNRAKARSKGKPWIEIMFKAKSKRRTRLLRTPKDLHMSIQWSEKGSYRQEHILRLLKNRLEPWTPERAASQDYRVLFMDVARSHVGDEVSDFAWTRGYIALFHYGCTTGVLQVNDTDNHCEFERLFVEFEQQSFNNKQLLDPSDIRRSAQEVIDDVAATWRSIDHTQGVDGHWRNGLSNKLDGSEDHLICRGAAEFWHELNMDGERKTAIAEVDAAHAAGTLTWDNVRSLIKHPEGCGIMEEGAELEAPLEPDECLHADEKYCALVALDDQDSLEEVQAEKSVLVQKEAGDDPAALEEAEVCAKRLVTLRRFRAAARQANVLVAEKQADEAISQLQRGHRSKTGEDIKTNHIFRRHLRETAEAEAKKLKEAREESFKARMQAGKVSLLKAREKTLLKFAKAKADKEKAEHQAKLDALPKTWNEQECGQGKHFGRLQEVKNRRECLERLKLRSPPLSFSDEVLWKQVSQFYSVKIGKDHELGTGIAFLKKVNAVLVGLGEHLVGTLKHKESGGDPEAFAKFFRQMKAKMPHKDNTVTM